MEKIDFSNCREVPKNINNRFLGEGDVVLRDKDTRRICAWVVGTEDEVLKKMMDSGRVYRSVGYYDLKEGIVI